MHPVIEAIIEQLRTGLVSNQPVINVEISNELAAQLLNWDAENVIISAGIWSVDDIIGELDDNEECNLTESSKRQLAFDLVEHWKCKTPDLQDFDWERLQCAITKMQEFNNYEYK